MTMTNFMAVTVILLLLLSDMTRKKKVFRCRINLAEISQRDFCEGRLVYHR